MKILKVSLSFDLDTLEAIFSGCAPRTLFLSKKNCFFGTFQISDVDLLDRNNSSPCLWFDVLSKIGWIPAVSIHFMTFHAPFALVHCIRPGSQVKNCWGCQWRHRRVGRIGFGQPLCWCQWGHQSPAAHNKDSSCCMGQCLCFGISCYFNPWPPALTGVFYRDTCKWKKSPHPQRHRGHWQIMKHRLYASSWCVAAHPGRWIYKQECYPYPCILPVETQRPL